MSRKVRIAIVVALLLGVVALTALLSQDAAEVEVLPAAAAPQARPERAGPDGEQEPTPPRAEKARPPAEPTRPTFVLQLFAPGGGPPGRCWIELTGPSSGSSGPTDDGRFEADFEPGAVSAFASCVEGYGRGTFWAPQLDAALTLEPNAILSVDVVWSDGRPAAGVEVAAEVQQFSAKWVEQLAARTERGQLRTIRRLTTVEGHVELSLPPALVSVVAREGRTALYLPRAEAAPIDPRGAAPSHLVTGSIGGAQSQGGLARVSREADLRSEPAQHLVLTLPLGGALFGTVVDEAQKPVPGLELVARNPSEPSHPLRGELATTTDGSGRFSFPRGIPPLVQLSGEGVRLAVGVVNAPLVVVQRQRRVVDGRVVGPDGQPQPRVLVDGHQTQEDGSFSFEADRWENQHTFELLSQPSNARRLVTFSLGPGVTHLGTITFDPQRQ